MYKFLIILSVIVLASTNMLFAQRRSSKRLHVVQQPAYVDLMRNYQFEDALKVTEKALSTTQNPIEKDSLQRLKKQAVRAMEMLPATRRITIIDSVVVDEKDLLSSIRLSEEAGRWVSVSTLFQPHSRNAISFGSIAFVNSLNNTAFFSIVEKKKLWRLHSSYRSDNGWNTPVVLEGIDTTYLAVDYPFVLPDGVTLYFSAKGEESIGGYDIFVTRYSPETRQHLRPTNLGMPFNSPANDYFYAIDQNAGVGIFATDRNQSEGKVCIYTFIPSIEHVSAVSDSTSVTDLKAAARISSVAATQHGKEKEILKVRSQREQALQKTFEVENEIFFVINDETIYTSLSAFQNMQARKLASHWLKLEKMLRELSVRQEAEQEEYAHKRTERLSVSLRFLETKIKETRTELKHLAKKIRLLESSSKAQR